MATIIKTVAFNNFYNYYGDYMDNQYNFKTGINIVNADNNMGKSKFYNGFMWLLEDKVYDSDLKAFKDVNESLDRIASGKAKTEETKFKVGVKVVFENNGVEYTIEKYADFFHTDGVLDHSESKVNIMKHENNADTPILDIVEQKNIINRDFIPLALRPYALLQGESMDRLVDLSSKQALSQTIDTLAGISVLKEVCEIAKKMTKKAEALYKQVDRDSSKTNKEKLENTNQRDKIQEEKDELLERLENDRDELTSAKSRKEELDAYIGNSKRRTEIRVRLESIDKEIDDNKANIEEIEKSITKQIFDEDNPWLLIGLENELETFKTKREKYIGDLAVQNNSGTHVILLPEGSPDTSSLKRMLEKERCEICGQSACKGSDAWEHIKMILNRPKKVNSTRNDFRQFYGELDKSASKYFLAISKIEDKIEKTKEKLDGVKDVLKDLKEKKDEISTDLNNAGGNADNSEYNDKRLVCDYNKISNDIRDYKDDIERLKKQISIFDKSISSLNDKIKKYGKNPETEKYEDFFNILKSISAIINETKDRIFDRTIKALELEANNKYKLLTEGNQSSGGKLVFKKEHDIVNVSIRDINNGEITGLGTGFQRMKQLSIVMAIISSKIGNEKKFDYPFISDAPFSEFGGKFISNFFKVAPSVFSQSIIMIKELYDPDSKGYLTTLGREILKNMKEDKLPGTFYVNVIKEKADTTGLVTSHICYKE